MVDEDGRGCRDTGIDAVVDPLNQKVLDLRRCLITIETGEIEANGFGYIAQVGNGNTAVQ